ERNLNMASMITCIANAYDNLRRNTPEQEALSLTDALNWMDRRLAVDFHPLLLKKFRELVKGQATEDVDTRSGSHPLRPINKPNSSR
ncbi:MAG: hypothetical protein KKE57_01415, partial [Proteobacteria bacterium]|nr:hypothetical protein [Pseudomonadota bacterium]